MESDDDDNENAGTKYVIDKKTVEQRNMENNKDAQKRKVGVLSLVAPKGGHASIVDYIYDTGLSAYLFTFTIYQLFVHIFQMFVYIFFRKRGMV